MKKQNYKKVVCSVVLSAAMLLCSGCGFGSEKEVNRVAPIAQSMEDEYLNYVDVVSADISNTVTLTLKTNRNRVESLNFTGIDVKINKVNFEVGDEVKEGDVLLESDASEILASIESLNKQISEYNTLIDYYSKLAAMESSRQSVCTRYGLEYDDTMLNDYNTKVDEYTKTLNVANLQLEEMNWELYASKIYAPFDGVVGYIAPVGMANDVVNSSMSEGDPEVVATVFLEEATFSCVTSKNYEYFQVGEIYTLDYDMIIDGQNQNNSGHFDWGWGWGEDFNEYTPETVPEQMQVECTSIEVKNEDTGTYELIFKPYNTVVDFSQVYAAEINLVIESKDNVTCIPKDALVITSDGYAVYLLNEDGSRTIQNVEVGIESETYVEITGGLEVGDQIISDKATEEVVEERAN